MSSMIPASAALKGEIFRVPFTRHVEPEQESLPYSVRLVVFLDGCITRFPAVPVESGELFSDPGIETQIVVATHEFHDIAGSVRTDSLDCQHVFVQFVGRQRRGAPRFEVELPRCHTFR